MTPNSISLAELLLRQTGLNAADSARLMLELFEKAEDAGIRQRCLSNMNFCRRIMDLGLSSYLEKEQSLLLQDCMERYIARKQQLRPRSREEVQQICHRILKGVPQLCLLSMREIRSEQCQELLQTLFPGEAGRHKAKRILSGLFRYAQRHAWCDSNPLDTVELPPLREKRIEALSLHDIKRLLRCCLRRQHRPCAAAVGLMLWAGVRPNEAERLSWRELDLQEGIISIHARHSKTGGTRHVSIHSVLRRWLEPLQEMYAEGSPICPKNWAKRWRDLRHAAGLQDWQPDSLRHSFASYHLKHFRNLELLQMEMGHGSSKLLRNRYLNLKGLSHADVQEFWDCPFPAPAHRHRAQH